MDPFELSPQLPPASIPSGTIRQRSGPWGAAYLSPWFWVRVCCLVPLVITGWLYFFQRSLIYVPTKTRSTPVAEGFDEPVQAVAVTTREGLQLHGWLVGGEQAVPAAATVLYFPGNAGHRGYRALAVNALNRAGLRVAIFDYRGYAENPGRPSEEAIAADAQAQFAWLTAQGVPPRRVVLYGESLGGGPATRLAAELSRAGTPPGGLILQSTFTSLADTAALHFPWLPVRWLLCEKHASAEQVRDVSCPVLVIHGERDAIIPFAQGRALFDAAPLVSASGVPKQFLPLAGVDHNDVYDRPRPALQAALGHFSAVISDGVPSTNGATGDSRN